MGLAGLNRPSLDFLRTFCGLSPGLSTWLELGGCPGATIYGMAFKDTTRVVICDVDGCGERIEIPARVETRDHGQTERLNLDTSQLERHLRDEHPEPVTAP